MFSFGAWRGFQLFDCTSKYEYIIRRYARLTVALACSSARRRLGRRRRRGRRNFLAEQLQHLDLGLEVEPRGHIDDALDGGVGSDTGCVGAAERDEGPVVDVDEEPHKELAVHAVREPAVTRDEVAKVLDLERALEARSEEAAEGRDDGRKDGHDEPVELRGRVAKGDRPDEGAERGGQRHGDGLSREHGVERAGGVREGQRRDGAGQDGEPRHDARDKEAREASAHERAQKTLPRLARRQRDERGAAAQHAPHVGPRVVGDDEQHRQREPEEAREHIVEQEGRLEHNHGQRDEHPREHAELAAVQTLVKLQNCFTKLFHMYRQ